VGEGGEGRGGIEGERRVREGRGPLCVS